MSKRQLIDDIRRYNATAQPQFLAQFDESALKQYLEHRGSAAQARPDRGLRPPWPEAQAGFVGNSTREIGTGCSARHGCAPG